MKNLKRNALVTGVVCMFVTLLTPAFAQQSAKLTDADIAKIAVVANQNDIDFAKIALQKSKDPKVIEFANTMISDHQAIIDMAVALVTKLKVTPSESPVSKEYLANAQETMKMLNGKSDKSFDKAYVDNEVEYHKAVINAVKTVLIPQAQNEELKALLQKALPILETHLQHAEMLKSEMK
ncbi:MAG TPA: DUF4142 domain-containing protein [Chitinophagales bacterium]|nr:DUF4142 domain-containing protein [Chitinophagales bacterium]